MSHTNETLNYQLPQFVGSDKPAWLTDINGAFSDIDAAIYAAKSEADTNAGNISDLGTTVAGHTQTLSDQGDAITGLRTDVNGNTGSINSINSLIGNGHPTTSNQTIIGAINSTEASVAPSEDGDDLAGSYSAGDQFMRGGTLYEALGALTAGTAFASLVLNTDYKVAYPVVSQIGTLANKVDTSHLIRGYDSVSVTADGVKTKSALLDELHAAFVAYVAAATGKIGLASLVIGYGYSVPSTYITPFNGGDNISWAQLGYVLHGVSTTAVGIEVMKIVSSGSLDTNVECTSSGNTITDISATVPTDGTVFTLELILYT